MAPSSGRADLSPVTPGAISIRTSTTIRATGAHYDTTAPEIIEQTGGRITHFVAGLGTSGTFVGAGRRLREFNAAIRLISVQPDSPLHGLEGLKHMETAIVPGIYDPGWRTKTSASAPRRGLRDHARQLAREGSARRDLERRESRRRIARRSRCRTPSSSSSSPDGGEKYLSERFWERGRQPCRGAAPKARTLGPQLLPGSVNPGRCGDSRARRGDVSQRVLRRADRPRRRRFREDFRAAEHDGRRPAAPLSRAAAGLS